MATPSFNGLIDVMQYGAKGNGSTDDYAAIVKALAACKAGYVLYFPPSSGYAVSQPIVVSTAVHVQMDSPIIYTGSSDVTALTVGIANTDFEMLNLKLNVVRGTLSSWKSESNIGIKLLNLNTCQVNVVQTRGFTIGLQCIGTSNNGFAYNQVVLGNILNNKISIDLTNATNGWCNENLFLSGQIANWSDVYPTQNKIGVRITSQDKIYTNNNNNFFIKASFEFQGTSQKLPVLIEYGSQNGFLSCRSESGAAYFAQVLNNSTENYFDLGYTANQSEVILDQSLYPANFLTTRRTKFLQETGNMVFLSGALHKKAVPYDAKNVNLADVAIFSGTSIQKFGTGMTMNTDYLQVASGTGIGILVNTTNAKRFVVKRDTISPYDGRVAIKCYDSSGNPLTDKGSPLVKGTAYSVPAWYKDTFGGVYQMQGDSPMDFYFQVDASVKSIAIIVTAGTNPLQIRSFSVATADGDTAAAWSGIPEMALGTNYALQTPTTGSWTKGKMILNDNPASGSPIGWVCVQSGTPGSWKPYGSIS